MSKKLFDLEEEYSADKPKRKGKRKHREIYGESEEMADLVEEYIERKRHDLHRKHREHKNRYFDEWN